MGGCSSCPPSCSCGSKVVENTNKIKHTIGIMSGKGGVGKSTVTVMFARELAKKGYKVGIIDADITGPSIPRLTNTSKLKVYGTAEKFYPVTSEDGIKIVSLNLMNRSEDEPVIWRGPIVGQAVNQFWKDVVWGEIDYMLIDMPPGTGDVALTVMQSIKLDGVVMVSIPQDMVSMIVAKAVNMAKKMNVKVLGVVENMSYIICPCCDEKISMDDEIHSHDYLRDMELDLLGELPMKREISKMSRGNYDASISEIFSSIVEKLVQKVENK